MMDREVANGSGGRERLGFLTVPDTSPSLWPWSLPLENGQPLLPPPSAHLGSVSLSLLASWAFCLSQVLGCLGEGPWDPGPLSLSNAMLCRTDPAPPLVTAVPLRPRTALARGGAPRPWCTGINQPGASPWCIWARQSPGEAAGCGDREGSLHASQGVPSPPHLLGLRGQRLLQEGLPQQVQVIQTTAHWQGHLRWGPTVHAGGRSGGWGFCAIR